MRATLLAILVAGICMAAFTRPYLGLLGYIWFALMRPDVLAWVYGRNRYSLIIAVCVLIGAALHLPARWMRLWKNPISAGVLVLLALITLSAILAENRALALEPFWLYLRVVGLALLALVLFDDERRLQYMLLVMAASVGLLGFKYGLAGLLAGGVRFAHGYGGMMEDNNTLALGFAVTVPLCWYAAQLAPWKPAKLAFWLMFFHTIAAVIMTFSRGAALALAAGLFMIWWHSRHKLVLAAVLVLCAIPGLLLVQSEYIARLSTITSPLEEPSAASRITMAKVALRMWADYPWLGVGFGRLNQQVLAPRYLNAGEVTTAEPALVVHNTYLQLLVDSGIFAFLVYCGLLSGTIWWLGREVARARRMMPSKAIYPAAVRSALVTFAVGAAFLSRVEFDLTYYLLMAAAIWYEVRHQALAPQAAQSTFPETTSPPSHPAWVVAGEEPASASPGVGRGSSWERWRHQPK